MDRKSRMVAIGSSAGGVPALLKIAPNLLACFPAPIVIVQHIGTHRSHLPALLSNAGPNPAVFAETGMVSEAGTIYVAPSDHHLLLEDGRFRLFRGPKEHHARPAINPLFRSMALDAGARTIGVILTGMLDDGAAGLSAIKTCGGTAVVQDPASAVEPSMPRSAMAGTAVDHICGVDQMAELLNSLTQFQGATQSPHAPDWLRVEHAFSVGRGNMDDLATIGTPSPLTCPDCGGALFELTEGKPLRFLCHTGHAFSLRSLAWTQGLVTDGLLYSGLRAVQEKEAILRRLAQEQSEQGVGSGASALEEAAQLAAFGQTIRAAIIHAPAATGLDDEDDRTEKP